MKQHKFLHNNNNFLRILDEFTKSNNSKAAKKRKFSEKQFQLVNCVTFYFIYDRRTWWLIKFIFSHCTYFCPIFFHTTELIAAKTVLLLLCYTKGFLEKTFYLCQSLQMCIHIFQINYMIKRKYNWIYVRYGLTFKVQDRSTGRRPSKRPSPSYL